MNVSEYPDVLRIIAIIGCLTKKMILSSSPNNHTKNLLCKEHTFPRYNPSPISSGGQGDIPYLSPFYGFNFDRLLPHFTADSHFASIFLSSLCLRLSRVQSPPKKPLCKAILQAVFLRNRCD